MQPSGLVVGTFSTQMHSPSYFDPRYIEVKVEHALLCMFRPQKNKLDRLSNEKMFIYMYSACRLIGLQIIESAAYCNQLLLVLLCLNLYKKTLVN